jgi:hypothetical protein
VRFRENRQVALPMALQANGEVAGFQRRLVGFRPGS